MRAATEAEREDTTTDERSFRPRRDPGEPGMSDASRGSRFPASRGSSAAATVHAEPRIVTNCVLPARLRVNMRLAECANHFGPLVSLQASLALPGLQARVTFRDRPNREDVPYQEVSSTVPLVLPGERLERPLLTARGAPAPARLTLRLGDSNRQPLVPAHEIECVSGSRLLEFPILLEASAIVWLAAQVPGANGARLRVNGKLVFPRGVTARIDPGPEAERRDRPAPELPLVAPGTNFFFYERTVESGLPGDPWVSMRFMDERGSAIGEEQAVGLFHAA